MIITFGYDEVDIMNVMEKYGFKSYRYDPFTRELYDLKGKKSSNENTIFIRNYNIIKKRLKNAKYIEINNQKNMINL